MPVIGHRGLASAEAFAAQLEDFRQGLGAQGFTESSNTQIEYRRAGRDPAKLPVFAQELVRRRLAARLRTRLTEGPKAYGLGVESWGPCFEDHRDQNHDPSAGNRMTQEQRRVPTCQLGSVHLFDHAVSLDFHKPCRIDEARNLDKRARRANVTKKLTMRASCIPPTADVRQHDPRPNDIRHCSPCVCDGFTNYFEAKGRLPIDIAGSRGVPYC
jgi:hypothetical protein